jgi:dihydropteroate synthase
LIVGILNITPDSFSDGNRYFSRTAAVEHGLRVLPVVEGLLELRPDAILSVDTYQSSTARCVIEAGAEIINDVSGLLWDPEMADVLARERPGAILMHTRGAPRMWNALPALPHADILPLVVSGLSRTLSIARTAGVPREHVVLDPGFGFGKMGDENFTLLAQFDQLQQFDVPLLAGVSRKRFLTAQLAAATDSDRLQATSAANVAAILAGAHLIRVHDVPAGRAAAAVADAVLASAYRDSPEAHPSGIGKISRS